MAKLINLKINKTVLNNLKNEEEIPVSKEFYGKYICKYSSENVILKEIELDNIVMENAIKYSIEGLNNSIAISLLRSSENPHKYLSEAILSNNEIVFTNILKSYGLESEFYNKKWFSEYLLNSKNTFFLEKVLEKFKGDIPEYWFANKNLSIENFKKIVELKKISVPRELQEINVKPELVDFFIETKCQIYLERYGYEELENFLITEIIMSIIKDKHSLLKNILNYINKKEIKSKLFIDRIKNCLNYQYKEFYKNQSNSKIMPFKISEDTILFLIDLLEFQILDISYSNLNQNYTLISDIISECYSKKYWQSLISINQKLKYDIDYNILSKILIEKDRYDQLELYLPDKTDDLFTKEMFITFLKKENLEWFKKAYLSLSIKNSLLKKEALQSLKYEITYLIESEKDDKVIELIKLKKILQNKN